jgi:hypothetical protein
VWIINDTGYKRCNKWKCGNVGILAAANIFSVPYITLQNRTAEVRLKHALGAPEGGNPEKVGSRTILGENMENKLCKRYRISQTEALVWLQRKCEQRFTFLRRRKESVFLAVIQVENGRFGSLMQRNTITSEKTWRLLHTKIYSSVQESHRSYLLGFHWTGSTVWIRYPWLHTYNLFFT